MFFERKLATEHSHTSGEPFLLFGAAVSGQVHLAWSAPRYQDNQPPLLLAIMRGIWLMADGQCKQMGPWPNILNSAVQTVQTVQSSLVTALNRPIQVLLDWSNKQSSSFWEKRQSWLKRATLG
jgi:hypothetical protein